MTDVFTIYLNEDLVKIIILKKILILIILNKFGKNQCKRGQNCLSGRHNVDSISFFFTSACQRLFILKLIIMIFFNCYSYYNFFT